MNSSRSLFWWMSLVLLLAAYGLRVYALDSASLWYDEALTFIRTQGDITKTIDETLGSGNQVPLYYVLLHLLPHDADFTLRYTSVLAGTLGVAVMIGVVRRLYRSRQVAWWCGALIAANPLHIWLSRTARPYALLFVLLVLVSFSFLMLLRKPESRRYLILLTLGSMLAYQTHYFALVLPMAQYLTLGFMLQRRRLLYRWLVAQVIAGIPLLIWAGMLVQQESIRLAIEWIHQPSFSDIPITIWNLTVGYTGSFPVILWPGFLAALIGVGAGMITVVRQWRTTPENLYWLFLPIVPFIVVFVESVTFRPLYEDRYFLFMIVGLGFLTAVGWIRFAPALATTALLLIVLSGAFQTVVSFTSDTHIRADWKRAATFVRSEREPDDVVLVDNQLSLYLFQRYYDDQTLLSQVLYFGKMGFDPYAPQPVMDSPPRASGRVWAVYRNPRDDCHRQGKMPDFDPFAPNNTAIARWLIAHENQVVESHEFNGVKIILLVLNQDNPTGQ